MRIKVFVAEVISLPDDRSEILLRGIEPENRENFVSSSDCIRLRVTANDAIGIEAGSTLELVLLEN